VAEETAPPAASPPAAPPTPAERLATAVATLPGVTRARVLLGEVVADAERDALVPLMTTLRDDPRWSAHARIWPFETGLGLPDEARIVFAEVWPSWWKACAKLGPPNDKAQVRTVARIFAAADRAVTLAGWFGPDVGGLDRQQIIEEEAWTLGVTAPRVRATRRPPKKPVTPGLDPGVYE